MHDCRGGATILVSIFIPKVTGQFNSNYKSGIEVLEDCAVDELLTLLPQEFGVDVRDVTIEDYQLMDAEKEVDNEG
jgi:hypothetical protein